MVIKDPKVGNAIADGAKAMVARLGENYSNHTIIILVTSPDGTAYAMSNIANVDIPKALRVHANVIERASLEDSPVEGHA